MLKVLGQNVKKWPSRYGNSLVEQILKHNADILCLTEHLPHARFNTLKSMFLQAGYAHFYESISSENRRSGGVLVVSKQPLEPIMLDFWNPEDTWRLATFRVHGFIISAAYWPQKQKKEAYWQAWLATANSIRHPFLSLGDFNTGNNLLDKTEGGTKFFCADYFDNAHLSGMIDIWRMKNGTLREYTWFSRAGNGFRVDHAFGNEALKGYVQRCYYDHRIREQGISDHTTLIVELSFPEKPNPV